MRAKLEGKSLSEASKNVKGASSMDEVSKRIISSGKADFLIGSANIKAQLLERLQSTLHLLVPPPHERMVWK